MINIDVRKNENRLVGAIYELIIVDEYYDFTRVGKDDFESDFITLTNFKDSYIYGLVTDYLDKVFKRVSDTDKKYVVKYEVGWTFNGLARYPRKAYIVNSQLETYRKLWLVEKLVKRYSASEHDKHFEKDFFSNTVNRLYWKYRVNEVKRTNIGYDYELQLTHPENAEEETPKHITIANENPDLEYVQNLADCVMINQYSSQLWEQ